MFFSKITKKLLSLFLSFSLIATSAPELGLHIRAAAEDLSAVGETTEYSTTYYLVDTNGALSQVLAEYDESRTLITSYTRADQFISQERDGQKSYYLYDGFDSVRMLADEEGTVTDTYTYDAFGNLLSSTGETENSFLYRGEQFDSFTGLYYLRARYMNPSTGTFITMDEYSGSVFEPVSLHKYLYANANPVMYSDPSGYYSTLADQQAASAGEIILSATPVPKYAVIFNRIMTLLKTSISISTMVAPFLLPLGCDIVDLVEAVASGELTAAVIAVEIRESVIDDSLPDAIGRERDKPKKDNDPILFPANPYDFHPCGLTMQYFPGTFNGSFIVWQDVSGNTIFRWDENPNEDDGPHYHIPELDIGKKSKDHIHFYPGYVVPEPYATIYFRG